PRDSEVASTGIVRTDVHTSVAGSGAGPPLFSAVARNAGHRGAGVRTDIAGAFDGHVARFRGGDRGRRERSARRDRDLRRPSEVLGKKMLDVVEREGVVTFAVRVQPRASRDEIAGELDGALKVRLLAPAIEGRANEALIECLAAL